MFLGCGGHHTDDTLRQAAHEKISKFRKMKAVFWNQSKAILMCLGIFFRGPLALKMNQLRAAFALWASSCAWEYFSEDHWHWISK